MKELADLRLIRFCYEKPTKVRPIAPEKIPYLDLTYCISGQMHYIYEDKEYILRDGDAILFPKGTVRIRKKSDIDTLYCSFNITYEDFEPQVKGYIPNCIRYDTLNILDSAKKTFFSVSEVKHDKCISLFMYLYYQLIEAVENNENPHIKAIKKYIAKHYKEKITLEEIAQGVHLSPQYCCTIFSKYMGQPLFEFISTQRIEEAKGLIITTDYSFTEISELAGFEDYNYFSRIFKKITGVNVRDYKKLNKNL